LKPALYLFVDFSGDANASRLTQSLEPRGDVDPIAEDSVVIEKHIPLIDPDPELHSPVRGNRSIALQHGFLNRNSTFHRIQNAGELSKNAVTGSVDNPALITGNHGKDDTLVPFEGGNRVNFVFAHKGAVARDISCQNRGETTATHFRACRVQLVLTIDGNGGRTQCSRRRRRFMAVPRDNSKSDGQSEINGSLQWSPADRDQKYTVYRCDRKGDVLTLPHARCRCPRYPHYAGSEVG
jgi:hypothetical protein